MERLSEMFGAQVFGDSTMRQWLSAEGYAAFKTRLAEGRALTRDLADQMAAAMMDWATSKGATHYTHWFQPMTGITAEKHDAFLSTEGEGVIQEFSGKALIVSEPDASSFPSGGLRATFEARGYTAWDPTSYAFLKDNTLCIPTAFCGYNGEALDKKTPLLRSMEALNVQAKRILKLFGKDVRRVSPTVGAEQEYFLIDQAVFNRRPDLIYTGRTLFGARPPKGQELDDHYFGVLKPRVAAFMKELDEELWKLGVPVKTEHNEAAPAQHELAPIFTTANIATDHNQLIMELMKKTASRFGMACLLHEKPFEGVNGSGKHNNWSMTTDSGVNLLEPGDTPRDNAQFLLFLCAVLKAVDEHQDLLRISTASAGNDHRLGGHEAPPAIISVFLGDELTGLLKALEAENDYAGVKRTEMNIGVNVLPRFPKDTTDRNRTSPFAFTGNKFEFRMLGAPASVAEPNIMLNTIVADVLMEFADRLEQAEDFTQALNALIRQTIRAHKRIIFGGNSYCPSWVAEAQRRGLADLRSAAEAIPRLTDARNVALFKRHAVFTEVELNSRKEIMLEHYVKVLSIEALTMLDMVSRDILPGIMNYSAKLGGDARVKQEIGVTNALDKALCEQLSELAAGVHRAAAELDERLHGADESQNAELLALYYRQSIFPAMAALRQAVDAAEPLVPTKLWPYPNYGNLLFSVS
ncbi:MAG: glutamine synthetase III [Christensenellaceae bacterium]|nr:glutamine synthetase III [Christensenellaceae bacterium]